MNDSARPANRYVVGPDGSPLSLADLPARNSGRWVARRKAQVVCAVRGGLLTFDEARDRYALTIEEFMSWHESVDARGLPGLRVTRLQDLRRLAAPTPS